MMTLFNVMRISFFTSFILTIVSCVNHQNENEKISLFPKQEKVEVKYAQGFDVNYGDGFVQIVTHSFGKNEAFSDTVFLQTKSEAKIASNSKIISPEIKSLVCQSSTHLAYLDVLNAVDKVTALCGIDYVQNEKINKQLDKNNTIELCLAERVEMEKLLEVNSDLFFTYPFGSEGNEKYSSKGIKTLHIAEYLEETQLARIEWIKLFGLILGKAKEANNYFDEIEKEYLALRQTELDTNKKFILNVPFEDNWFMPSANSLTVKIMEDAGMTYFYKETGATENDLHSKEEVWNDAMFADYWIIIANRPTDFSLADLISEEQVYAKFKSVIHQQVIFCNSATSDYFANGVVEPQIMLKDILFATHKLSEHQPKYFFLLR